MFPKASYPADTNAELAKTVFDLARALFAPDALVHLGAGTGQGPLHQWRQWQVPQSLLVEAQGSRMAWATDWVAQSPGRYAKTVTVGGEGAKASFKVASNPNESGLIDPETLTGLWSNLKRVESLAADCVGLDNLLAQADTGDLQKSKKLWLLVDFLCSDAFWAGATETLGKSSVVVLRQSKTSLAGVESPEACDKRMETLGFMRVADLESNHPQVIHGVYLRNLATDLQQALAQRDQEAKAKTELAGKLEEESKARAALQQEKSTLSQDKSALAQEKAALEREKATLTQETTTLKAAKETETKAKEQALAQRDQEAKAKAELTGKLEEESKARAALQQEKTALQQDKSTLAQEKATLEKEKAALTQETAALKAAKDGETKAKEQALTERDQEARYKVEALNAKAQLADLSEDRKQKLENCRNELQATVAESERIKEETRNLQEKNDKNRADTEKFMRDEAEKIVNIFRMENDDLRSRQKLMQDELLKAEAQIDLIKDLLLRESGL